MCQAYAWHLPWPLILYSYLNLTLKGEIKDEEATEGKRFHRKEFRYGSFARTIPLPTTVKADQVTAELKDGVLTITIPKGGRALANGDIEVSVRTCVASRLTYDEELFGLVAAIISVQTRSKLSMWRRLDLWPRRRGVHT